jgi:hypothetical protein
MTSNSGMTPHIAFSPCGRGGSQAPLIRGVAEGWGVGFGKPPFASRTAPLSARGPKSVVIPPVKRERVGSHRLALGLLGELNSCYAKLPLRERALSLSKHDHN